MVSLLLSRRFGPLFATQFLGAFNDNLFKNAMVVMALFYASQSGEGAGMAAMLVALAGGLFILPYMLFSATAGRLADVVERSKLIRITKAFEILLMGLGGLSFLWGSLPLMLAVLFGLGLQSTFFSPMKYSVVPDHVPPEKLVAANGLLEAGTFLAILAGTIAGGTLIMGHQGSGIIASLGMACAVLGFLTSLAVPLAPPAIQAESTPVDWNLVRATRDLLRQARQTPGIWSCLLAISWFWTFGATMLAVFPVLVRQTLNGTPELITLLLTVFAVGTAIGSILCHKLLSGQPSPRFTWLAGLGLSLSAASFALTVPYVPAEGYPSVAAMLTDALGLKLLAELAIMAACGGIFSVPLYAELQRRAPESIRSSMVAANNVMNAAFMVAGAVGMGAASLAGIPPEGIIMGLAVINLLAIPALFIAFPHRPIAQRMFRCLFRLTHRVQVEGLENLPAPGTRMVIAPNHVTYLDGCLVAAFLPNDPVFAVYTGMAQKWWARPILALADVLLVDQTRPQSLRTMVRALQTGRPLVIFPEGRLTSTGGLMKVYEGAAVAADKADAVVVPVRLEGLEGNPLGRTTHLFGRRWFRRVRLVVLPPVRLEAPKEGKPRQRRAALGTALQLAMESAAFQATDINKSLWKAFLDMKAACGGKALAYEEADHSGISRNRLGIGAHLLGQAFRDLAEGDQTIGIMLPNTKAAATSFWACQEAGLVPAMLNFSAGAAGVKAMCQAAQLNHIVTARAFIEKARLQGLVESLAGEGLRIHWLEDIGSQLTGWHKFKAMLFSRFLPHKAMGVRAGADTPAAILFTSGSESTPKGVVLSHRNILANCAQMRARFDFTPADRVMNAMPMFHAFGLTGGTILPLLCGTRTLLYPSPLHYRVVPEVSYDFLATIVFATNTFLAHWGRFAHPMDFTKVRLAFAGAEKLKAETRALYSDRFGVRILEGYGATEAAPVVAVNAPSGAAIGSVGRLMPGMESRLEAVAGLGAEVGQLFIRGPNVMLGYLRAEKPGVLEPPRDGWHDTGDIIRVQDGFITIVDRAKRFAKIAGEMVSMGLAEGLASKLRPEAQHAVVNLPDSRKGEKLLLVTTAQDLEVAHILAASKSAGIPELATPREIRVVPEMPLLATGKVDYPGLMRSLAPSPEVVKG